MNPFVSKSQGYSKAVDMWSVGAITAALLTGDVVFVNRADPRFREEPHKMILHLASKCDLWMLDDPSTMWRTVGKRPKDFVKKLLVLDESTRMTATQALAHDWFMAKRYTNELDDVYQRSIEGWTPRRKVFRLVEALDVSRLAPGGSGNDHHDGSTSRFFASNPIAASQSSQNIFFKPGRNTDPPSLPKIEEETPAELQQSTTSVSDVEMTPYPDAQDPYSPDPFDVQHSMSQLAINASETTTDLPIEENDISGGRSYDFDADHEMAAGYTQNYCEPLPSLSSSEKSLGPEATALSPLPDRKRPSSPRCDDSSNIGDAERSVENLQELKYVRHTSTKRARVA
jgi:serine/threonine protein kinase